MAHMAVNMQTYLALAPRMDTLAVLFELEPEPEPEPESVPELEPELELEPESGLEPE